MKPAPSRDALRLSLLPSLLPRLRCGALVLTAGLLLALPGTARAGSDDFEFGQKLAQNRWFKQAQRVFDDAQRMLKRLIEGRWLQCHGVIGLYPANAVGDDIELYTDEPERRFVPGAEFSLQVPTSSTFARIAASVRGASGVRRPSAIVERPGGSGSTHTWRATLCSSASSTSSARITVIGRCCSTRSGRPAARP